MQAWMDPLLILLLLLSLLRLLLRLPASAAWRALPGLFAILVAGIWLLRALGWDYLGQTVRICGFAPFCWGLLTFRPSPAAAADRLNVDTSI